MGEEVESGFGEVEVEAHGLAVGEEELEGSGEGGGAGGTEEDVVHEGVDGGVGEEERMCPRG